MAKTRTCVLCGNKYSYCPTCPSDVDKPTWYFVFCGERCKTVNAILSAHTAGKLSKEEAKNRLSGIDISDMNIKIDENLKHIDEIMTATKKAKTKDSSADKVDE